MTLSWLIAGLMGVAVFLFGLYISWKSASRQPTWKQTCSAAKHHAGRDDTVEAATKADLRETELRLQKEIQQVRYDLLKDRRLACPCRILARSVGQAFKQVLLTHNNSLVKEARSEQANNFETGSA